MAVSVRKATPEDARGIVAIWQEIVAEKDHTVVRKAFTVAQQWSYLNTLEDREAIFVAEDDGSILGFQTLDLYASYTHSMDHVGVVRTYVSAGRRRQGIGRRLAETASQFAYEKGYEKLVARVQARNSPGRSFFESLGFVPVGTLRRQVHVYDGYDDQVIMERFLAVAPPQRADAPEAQAERPAPPPTPKPRPLTLPETEQVEVRRARRSDFPVLVTVLSRITGRSLQVVESELKESFLWRSYLIGASKSGLGVVSWYPVDVGAYMKELLVHPEAEFESIGGALLDAVEEDATKLRCEVALLFVKRTEPASRHLFYQQRSYMSQDVEQLHGPWREVAEELPDEDEFIMLKPLRQDVNSSPPESAEEE
jgi:L-amino acid N-acyltransferase YncA